MNYPEPDEGFPPYPSPRRPRPAPQPLLTWQIRDEHRGLDLITAHTAEEALAIFRFQKEYARDNYHGVPIDESTVYTAVGGLPVPTAKAVEELEDISSDYVTAEYIWNEIRCLGGAVPPESKAPELSELDQTESSTEDVWNGGRGWGGAAPPGKLWADNIKPADPDL